MDLTGLKEKLRSVFPLELLKTFKEALLALWSSVFSLVKGLFGHFLGGHSSDPSDELWQDEPSPLARKKKLILFCLGGATIVLLGIVIIAIVAKAPKPEGAALFNNAASFSIPPEELFFPQEPDFLPVFLPERESRRFWSLDDIRQYWRVPGNSDWWMEGIKSTVDSLMEEVP